MQHTPVDPRTEPPGAADEATTLRAFLDYHRETLRQKVAGLDADQLARPLPPSTMTLGGLVEHLALVEEHGCSVVLMGREYAEPWAGADREVATSDAAITEALARGGCDRLTVADVRGHDGPVTLRWVLVHLVEEYCRHNGNADLLRESIDGVVGE